MVLGAVAVAQPDLKQLLAASTAAQLGFVVLAAGVSATAGGTAHLVAHAATKALLFLAAGAWLTALGTKALPALRGAARRWPLVGVCATVGLLALAGVAPFSLWATKDEILAAARERSPVLAVVTLAAAVLSAAYAGKVLAVVWARPADDAAHRYDQEEPGTRRVPGAAQAALLPLAFGAAVLGALALPPLSSRLAAALGVPGETGSSPVELIGSAVLAILALAAVLRWGTPTPGGRWTGSASTTASSTGGCPVRPAERSGRRTARSGSSSGGSTPPSMPWRQAVRRSARQARRPQTGQLYQYYFQVVLLLLAAALLLIVVS